MAGQEPIDLVIILKIVEYMKLRAGDGTGIDPVDGAAIMNIVNHMAPGTSFGVLLQSETHNNQEVSVGDQYHVSGQAGAVGRDAHAENLTLNQIRSSSEVDLEELSRELELLRTTMRQQAATPGDDLAVAEIGQAMIAAERGDEEKASSHLKLAGQWALGVATTIGTTVAAGAIKSALGL
jgi:hypothetical protein